MPFPPSYPVLYPSAGPVVYPASAVAAAAPPEDEPPITNDDDFTSPLLAWDTFTDLDVLDNDTARTNPIDVTTVSVVSGPTGGTAVPQASGVIRYTPDEGTLLDEFTYAVEDDEGNLSNTSTVNVAVEEFLTPSLDAGTTYFNSAQSETDTRDINFTATTGDILVRMVARTNSGTALTMTGTWDQGGTNAAMTQIAITQPSPAASAGTFVWGAYIRGGATGAKVLRLTKNVSGGRYAVLIQNITNMPAGTVLGHVPTPTRNTNAVNNLAITVDPVGPRSLLLAWGGIVATADAKHPIGVAPDDSPGPGWTVDAQLNGDVVPDTSAHTRAGFFHMTGGAIGADQIATISTANAATDLTFAMCAAEILGEVA